MPQILRTTLIADEAVTADGVRNYDLPVNPLSCILLTIKALNLTTTIADYSAIAQLLAMITNLNVRYRGATIIDGSLTDLAVGMAAISGWGPHQGNRQSADNDVRWITVPLLFGRRPYDPMECFPATRRGDLVMQLTRDIAVTGADNLVIQAETVEILDAAPARFTKLTTQSPAAFAAGQNFIDLPIGNKLLGMLLRSFNVPDAADFQASYGVVASQVDNVEVVYSEANWETLHAELARRIPAWTLTAHRHHMAAHIHLMDAAAGIFPLDAADTALSSVAGVLTVDGAADVGITGIQPPAITHTLQQEDDVSLLENYAYLDFDPLNDGSYAIDTKGAAQVRLRVTADAADATQSRLLPLELVELAGAGAAPGG